MVSAVVSAPSGRLVITALRALRSGRGGAGAALVSVPAADLGPDDVRIAVRAVSASHLDLAVLAGTVPGADLPVTLGTDPAGRVLEVGAGQDQRLVGAAVAGKPNIFCGRCTACRSGAEADCERQTMIGVHRDGGAATEVVVPARVAFPLPAGLDVVPACAAIHTFPVALHMLRAAAGSDDLRGRTVLVTGAAGAVGSAVVQLVRLFGGVPLAVVRRGVDDALLRTFGAAEVFDAGEGPLAERVRDAAGGGVDIVAETTGSGDLASAAYACLGWRGTFVTCTGRPGAQLRVPLGDLYRNRRRIIGSASSDVRDVRAALAMVAAGQVRPQLATVLPLSEFERGYAALADPARIGKVVFEV